MQHLTQPDVGTVANLRRGQRVIAQGDQELGEVLGVITGDDAAYLHVLRYGPGRDEVFIPTIAVEWVVGNRVYLALDALDLVGEPWHTAPQAGVPAPEPSN